jgi:hypothetical protein
VGWERANDPNLALDLGSSSGSCVHAQRARARIVYAFAVATIATSVFSMVGIVSSVFGAASKVFGA